MDARTALFFLLQESAFVNCAVNGLMMSLMSEEAFQPR